MNDYWDIEFVAYTEDMNENVIDVNGTITVKADDIFQALELANERLKRLGFPYVNINGGKREEVQ